MTWCGKVRGVYMKTMSIKYDSGYIIGCVGTYNNAIIYYYLLMIRYI